MQLGEENDKESETNQTTLNKSLRAYVSMSESLLKQKSLFLSKIVEANLNFNGLNLSLHLTILALCVEASFYVVHPSCQRFTPVAAACDDLLKMAPIAGLQWFGVLRVCDPTEDLTRQSGQRLNRAPCVVRNSPNLTITAVRKFTLHIKTFHLS